MTGRLMKLRRKTNIRKIEKHVFKKYLRQYRINTSFSVYDVSKSNIYLWSQKRDINDTVLTLVRFHGEKALIVGTTGIMLRQKAVDKLHTSSSQCLYQAILGTINARTLFCPRLRYIGRDKWRIAVLSLLDRDRAEGGTITTEGDTKTPLRIFHCTFSTWRVSRIS